MLDKNLSYTIFNEDIRPIGPAFFEGLFEPALKTAAERDIPLYCGEYGVIDLADRADAVRWLSDIHDAFEKYAIGRAVCDDRRSQPVGYKS